MVLAAESQLRLDANWIDYLLVGLYFAFVIGIGLMAKRSVSTGLDFFLSGRSLPAWVTGLAFISANLGAVEVMGMSANGAQFGIPTVHYFWIGAVPAMLFLGIVMMPFYYGSKVRSVPEFMRRRFGTGAHLVNALSFAIAQLLIAGINLFLLAKILNILLGWNLYLSLVVAAVIVLSYITLGGLSAAIYNEVLQFFIIVAALLPLTLVGLHKVGGYGGLKEKITAAGDGEAQLSSWPGTNLTAIDSPLLSVIGLVFGLGFVLSFGYWTTNFVEVQRAMASNSISAGQRAPIIGSFPKMFVPFIVIFPGMIAAVVASEVADAKASGDPNFDYNNSLLYLIRDLLPNGMLGLAITGLLAAFMAGMAANVSAFNTVFSYDLWETYVIKDRSDDYYLNVGRIATVGATVVAIGTALIARNYQNIMDYLQTLFGFFNAPLFATFILGMFWKRMSATAGWMGLVSGTLAAVFVGVISTDVLGPMSLELIGLTGQGASFVAAGAAFVVDIVVSIIATLMTSPKPEPELRGLVYSLTPRSDFHDENEGELRVVPAAEPASADLADHGHHPQHRLLVRSPNHDCHWDRKAQGRPVRHPDHHRVPDRAVRRHSRDHRPVLQ